MSHGDTRSDGHDAVRDEAIIEALRVAATGTKKRVGQEAISTIIPAHHTLPAHNMKHGYLFVFRRDDQNLLKVQKKLSTPSCPYL